MSLSDNARGSAVGGGAVAKPEAEVVDNFHTNSDVDSRIEALHHTLGPLPSQAAPGDHVHDGGSSALILSGETISGSRATESWRLSVNAILVRLGARDLSSP